MSDKNTTINQGLVPTQAAIREARPEDMGPISDIDAQITGVAKPAYWPRAFARYGNRSDRWFLIAESDGQVIGFIVGERRAWEFGSPPCGWVFAIGVAPDNRLGGVGSLLFDALCGRMRKAGIETIRTMLARDDSLNMAFFRSQGMMGGPFIQLEMALPPEDEDGTDQETARS